MRIASQHAKLQAREENQDKRDLLESKDRKDSRERMELRDSEDLRAFASLMTITPVTVIPIP